MIKVMEYMSFGKPIVQFDLHEGRVSAGDASLYVAANDVTAFAKAIVQLIDDPEMRTGSGRSVCSESPASHGTRRFPVSSPRTNARS